MTTLTTLPFGNKYIGQFSKENDERKWMTTLRLEGLDLAQSLDLPKPDKTNITRWNFTQFKHSSKGEKISDLKNIPEQLKDFIDENNTPKNLFTLRNQSVAYASLDDDLKGKGV